MTFITYSRIFGVKTSRFRHLIRNFIVVYRFYCMVLFRSQTRRHVIQVYQITLHSFLGKWRKSDLGPGGLNINRRLYCCKQSVVHVGQILGWCVLFDPLFTQYKVQRSLSTNLKKKSNRIIEILTRKGDKNQLELGKGAGLRPYIYIHFI